MKKIILITVVLGLMVLVNSQFLRAEDKPLQPAAKESVATGVAKQAASKEALNVGNKICPVSGEKIDEKLKATYEYKGKIYNFCCAMCVDSFKSNPEKYIKKVEDELQKKPGEGTKEEDKTTGEDMHEGHQH